MAKAKTAKRSTAGFTKEEREAMRERARETKRGKGDGEADLLAKVAEMPDSDRVMAKRLHALVKDTAPDLTSRTWYGMPAYANESGEVVCFFQSAAKFKSRYATLGFSDKAQLDEGAMWPTSFALAKIGKAEEKEIRALVKRAIG